jgi:hypothetical protein
MHPFSYCEHKRLNPRAENEKAAGSGEEQAAEIQYSSIWG